MSVAVGLSGWLLGAAGCAASCAAIAVLRRRLNQQAEAVARACHELRGPLTSARLGLELGARIRSLPPGRLRAIELELGRASLALEDLSRPCLGLQPSSIAETVDVTALVADCTEAWQAAAEACAVRLCFRASARGPVVVGDRLRLAQAIGNLLANAIEHGGGRVEIGLRAEGETIRVEVVDEGPGLPAPIDELIHRARSRGRRAGAARGHGLAIVSAIAAAHDGRLATGPSDRGARLVLELPVAAAAFAGTKPAATR